MKQPTDWVVISDTKKTKRDFRQLELRRKDGNKVIVADPKASDVEIGCVEKWKNNRHKGDGL
jgi:hypothetical protein